MASQLPAYRVYASSLSSFENLQNASLNEVHIVLAFARDYNHHHGGNHQTGKFIPCFDISTITPRKIKTIKDNNNSTSVKFFLSIGGRDPKLPFAVTSADESKWIQEATESLAQIVTEYHIDGIDVYYEHINSDVKLQFVNAIHQVIWKLKTEEKAITQASITVSAPVSSFYHALYNSNDKLFDYVVYQPHTEQSPISTVEDLVAVFNNATKLPYPKGKIFAGYSDVRPVDWTNVPPPIFLFAVPQLTVNGLFGISKWIATHD